MKAMMPRAKHQRTFPGGLAVRSPVRVEVHSHAHGQLLPRPPVVEGRSRKQKPWQPNRRFVPVSIHSAILHHNGNHYSSPDISLHNRTYAIPFS